MTKGEAQVKERKLRTEAYNTQNPEVRKAKLKEARELKEQIAAGIYKG